MLSFLHYTLIYFAKYFLLVGKFLLFYFLKAPLSLARPYQDWDQNVKTIAQYKEKFRRVNIEMAVCLSINIVVSLVMQVPHCYTGRCRVDPSI